MITKDSQEELIRLVTWIITRGEKIKSEKSLEIDMIEFKLGPWLLRKWNKWITLEGPKKHLKGTICIKKTPGRISLYPRGNKVIMVLEINNTINIIVNWLIPGM